MARSLSCIPYRPVVGPPERAWIENALFFCVFLPSPAREAAASRAMKIENTKGPKPFLKWVGGKTQLLPELMARLPHDFSTTIKVYAEPFVGGGALLFHLLSKGLHPERIVINDSNPELANVWRTVQIFTDYLVESLARLEADYLALSCEDAKRAFYLGIRSAFNAGRLTGPSPDVSRAAQMVFLNKTCFNGLYRVNAKGLFNVPFGKYHKPIICDETTIRNASTALKGVEILCGDFADSVADAGRGWLIYFDPPYRPISETSAFCDYTQCGFGDAEQRRLAKLCHDLDAKGARWLLSNSEAKDGFFDELYRGFTCDRVYATRAINSKGNGRGKIGEIIVSNIGGGGL